MAGSETATVRSREWRRWLAGVLALLLAVALGVAAWRATRPVEESVPPVPGGPYPRFADESAFYADVSRAPMDARSADMAQHLAGQVADRYKGVAALNTTKFAASFVRAGPETPRRDVSFDNCQRKPSTPRRLFDGPGYFKDVPIPEDARPAEGSDAHLAVWDPAGDTLWEFWKAKRRDDGSWQACWGGRIDDVSRSSGQFHAPYGAAASGLPHAGYMVTLEDARSGRIEHALGLVIPDPARGHSYPANRSDGTSANRSNVPEGTRLRLDPSVDVDSLRLSPLGAAIARAAQKYGFIVTDRGGAVAVMAEGADVWKGRTGQNPWTDLLGGVPSYQQLKGFPWDRLQVVQRDWGKPTG